MNKEFYTFLFIFLAMGLGYGNPRSAAAKSVSITNDVSVSASSGGNVVEGKEVRAHDSSGNIHIETRIDGKVIERVDESVVSKEGKPVELKRELLHEDKERKIKVQTKAHLKANPSRASQAAASPAENVLNKHEGEDRPWRQRLLFLLSSLFIKPFHALSIF